MTYANKSGMLKVALGTFLAMILMALALTSFQVRLAEAARLDGCDPGASENQNIKGKDWKSKCLKGSVGSVWESACDEMTLRQAKSSSSSNGCWKLFSRIEYAKQK